MAYEVNYDDKRFQAVESDKKEALSDLEKTYADMTSQSDRIYQQQIDASKQWAETQKQNQQAQTDFAIEKIEQQKEKAEKDYTKEQSGAYVDWQKESNRYGANAEQMASQGLQNTGYSESSQVNLFNTYQNRVMSAREAYNVAILNYDNAIKDARLQNNSQLAEIAYQALQKQLELSLQGFQYKNQLILDKTAKKLEIENQYYGRYQDVLNQINTENALQEQIRQYNEQMAEEKRQYNESMAFQREQFEWQKAKSGGSSGGSSSRSYGGGSQITKQSGNSSNVKPGSAVQKNPVNATEVAAMKYGTFSNGYQPRGVAGYGLLSATGDKVNVNGNTQNLWQTHDGTLWYWDGKSKEYVKTSKTPEKSAGVALGITSKYIK